MAAIAYGPDIQTEDVTEAYRLAENPACTLTGDGELVDFGTRHGEKFAVWINNMPPMLDMSALVTVIERHVPVCDVKQGKDADATGAWSAVAAHGHVIGDVLHLRVIFQVVAVVAEQVHVALATQVAVDPVLQDI